MFITCIFVLFIIPCTVILISYDFFCHSIKFTFICSQLGGVVYNDVITDLWGLDSYTTQDALIQKLDSIVRSTGLSDTAMLAGYCNHQACGTVQHTFKRFIVDTVSSNQFIQTVFSMLRTTGLTAHSERHSTSS